ncbi:MAG: L-histidine N(alpha)-methyltransferase [Planctomycetota bacterium]
MTVERLALVGAAPDETLEDFGEDVARGLARPLKRISCRWFYDEAGSALFEEICGLEEYYPTRAEAEILAAHADEIVASAGDTATCVELGSGSSVKTRHVLDAFFRAREDLTYVPIDISPTALRESADALLAAYPKLDVVGIVGEYGRGFEWMESQRERRKLVLWLGSNVGNFDRATAQDFLGTVRRSLGPNDRMLIGVDLRKDARVLEAAYDDAQGVTARFNLNVLERINRELGGTFDMSAFAHEAVYEEDEGRVVINLVSKRSQTIRIEALDMTVSFHADERVHTEDSYKYSTDEIDALAAAAGFDVAKRWLDGDERFSVNLFAPSATS